MVVLGVPHSGEGQESKVCESRGGYLGPHPPGDTLRGSEEDLNPIPSTATPQNNSLLFVSDL